MLGPPLKVFNPRGQDLSDQPSIGVLLGLLLHCIDPTDAIAQSVHMSQTARQVMNRWRADGTARIAQNDELRRFVTAWGQRTPTRRGGRARMAEERVSVNEIVYKLITWIPEIQYDIEQLALLEAVTRAVVAASVFGSFSSEIIFGSLPIEGLPEASVKAAIQSILVPIAEGAIDVNEDLLDTLPRDRISILTIHQAKGLEFPLTIVDVGQTAPTCDRSEISSGILPHPLLLTTLRTFSGRLVRLEPPLGQLLTELLTT